MSEYQYYEFQALDRSLTREQMAELRAVSSRAKITPRSFVNEYEWGDFKGDPNKWMDAYFDAFVYFANWGTRWFMLRLPAKVIDLDTLDYYCVGENLSFWKKDDHIVLSFDAELEDFEWEEESISLASLVPLRAALMRGDLRALYLGWLLGVQSGEVDEQELEPPLPSRMVELDSSLESLTDFLGIDSDLIAAAGESSRDEQLATPSKSQISDWVRGLPTAEKDAIIGRLIEGEDLHLSAEVRRRAISEITKTERPHPGPRRTAGGIVARAQIISAERKKSEAEKRAKEKAERERADAEARKKHLKSLAGKENGLWSAVDQLIATKQPRRYDEAVAILEDLRDLAGLKGKSSEFKSRVRALQRAHAAKGTLMERLRKAGLPAYEREGAG